MLRTISWSVFIQISLFIIISYYLIVTVLYYKKEIVSLFIRPMAMAYHEGNIKRKVHSDSDASADSKENFAFITAHELLEDLKVLFNKAFETKMIREELIQAIRSKLKGYPLIGETDLVEDINTHIILEAKEKCTVELLPEDLKQIWN